MLQLEIQIIMMMKKDEKRLQLLKANDFHISKEEKKLNWTFQRRRHPFQQEMRIVNI